MMVGIRNWDDREDWTREKAEKVIVCIASIQKSGFKSFSDNNIGCCFLLILTSFWLDNLTAV